MWVEVPGSTPRRNPGRNHTGGPRAVDQALLGVNPEADRCTPQPGPPTVKAAGGTRGSAASTTQCPDHHDATVSLQVKQREMLHMSLVSHGVAVSTLGHVSIPSMDGKCRKT